MKLGILGPPQSGKSTLFTALTRGVAESGSARGEKVNLGSVKVPDARLDRLREMHSPKKFTPAKVDYVDAPPLEEKGRTGKLSVRMTIGLLMRHASQVTDVRPQPIEIALRK